MFAVGAGRESVLFTNILDSVTALAMAMYTVYSRCGQYGWCMFHTVAGAAGAWFIQTLTGSVSFVVNIVFEIAGHEVPLVLSRHTL